MTLEIENAYERLGVGYVETYTGRHFELKNPEFDIEDIAHALSMTVRYGGHCREFYSVAEHSVLVSVLMEKRELGTPMVGLIHDATEAYLSDVPAPFKQFLPDWRQVDHDLEAQLYAWMGLPFPREAGCKTADWLALFIEAYDLIPSKGEAFVDPQNLRDEALRLKEEGFGIRCYDPWFAKRAFLDRYEQLQKQAGKS